MDLDEPVPYMPTFYGYVTAWDEIFLAESGIEATR